MGDVFGDQTVEAVAMKMMSNLEEGDLINEMVIADLIDIHFPNMKDLAHGDPGQWWSDLVSDVIHEVKRQCDNVKIPYRTH